MTNSLYILWSALFGLVFGSFLNVVILRDDRRKSILLERSACPNCNHVLSWFDLVPVISFLGLFGKCRYCKKPISLQYPLIEFTAGLLAVFATVQGLAKDSILYGVGLFIVCALFLVVSIIDSRKMEMPMEYVAAAGIIGGAASILSGVITWQSAGLGFLLGAGSLLLVLYGWRFLFKQDGMGEGDPWMAGAIGLIVGYPHIIISLMSAIFLGALIGVLLIAGRKRTLQVAIPFGPYLFIGMLIAIEWGTRIIAWYRI